MEQRTFGGPIDAGGLAQALVDEWDRGETIAQALEADDSIIVQIGQREGGWFSDEPRQALTLGIERLRDGVRVVMGQQQWHKQGGQIMVGGLIGIFPFFFTWPPPRLFGGDEPIDEAMPARIWQSVERYAGQYGAATGPTRRLATVACPSCGVANPEGAARCSACGSDLRAAACPSCGFSNPPGANFCINCGAGLSSSRSVGGPG